MMQMTRATQPGSNSRSADAADWCCAGEAARMHDAAPLPTVDGKAAGAGLQQLWRSETINAALL